MQGGTAVCSMGTNARSFFFGSLGSSDTVSCPEVSYVDDLALFISHDSPGKLCDSVVDITNRLTEIMASFGLELNMKAGKTECILSLRGRGTAEAQRQLARDGKQIILPTKYAKLRIVQSYYHLGIILTKTGCITPEIAKRCKAMLGAYLPIAHRVFASKEICRSTKLQLAHALLDGILFHGAATWPELSEGCLTRLEGAWNRIWCEHPVAWKGLVQKLSLASLDFEKQHGCESRETGPVDKQELSEPNISVQNVRRRFSVPKQEPLTNPGCMASEGQPWHMQGMENVPAALATLVREFGWSTICRTRQQNVCNIVSRTLLQCLAKSSNRWMLRLWLFEFNAKWKVVVSWQLRFQLKGARRRKRSVEVLCASRKSRGSDFPLDTVF